MGHFARDRREAILILSAAGAAFALAMTVAGICGSTAVAQQPSERFEVVSIRGAPTNCPFVALTVRCPELPPRIVRLFEGRLEAQFVTTEELIRVAYGLENADPDLVRGADGWMRKERYDVIGITGDLATGTVAEYPQTRQQLKTLLADRFALRIDTSKQKMFPVRILSDSGGPAPRLQRAAGPCSSAALLTEAPGTSRCQVGFSGSTFEGRGITMADLARALSARLSVPIIDETGRDGYYDVSVVIESANDPVRSGLEERIGLAMESQLGLGLYAGRRPVPILSVKGAKKPVQD